MKNNKKLEFLKRSLRYRAWAASVQRTNLYKKGADDAAKNAFRSNVIDFMEKELIPQYAKLCNEPQHYENIERLIDHANEVGGGILQNNYKYGIAQKLLNLTLKFYWCMDLVEEPPHCPIDRVIINQTQQRGLNWTQITEKETYQSIIEEIKGLAQDQSQSISMWEVEHY